VPTYEYRCEHCDRTFDIVQSFHDDALTACPTCGNPVRKVFGNVGIVFKGSGFYKTDSRTGSGTKAKEPAASTAASSDGGNGSSGDSAGSGD
jgi:putative FmdB family regulatory protein